ncbi:MAG: HAMP domain-containing histidine kinase [Anaerolineae bacterium]|nr:HAMP domain-containing histidine kinase [Anaerolineae bacterium]
MLKPTPGTSKTAFRLSNLLNKLLSLPPASWLARYFTRLWLKQRIRRAPEREATLERAATAGLATTLQGIVEDVVEVLGYSGAMVATYEQGDSLPVRALYIDPLIATEKDIHEWEQKISEFASQPVSITDPETARVYVYDEVYQDNLSVKAAKAGGPVTSNSLHDLFTPIAPPAAWPVIKVIQQILGIQQVIAVPFFLETLVNGEQRHELVGNLFAAKRSTISKQDIYVLSAFGRQAAAAIGSERRRIQVEIAQELTYRVQTSLNDETKILEWIVKGVVSDLGYVGAMVAPYEPDGALPAFALYVDPHIATEADIHRWEAQLSEVSYKQLSITDPDVARVYINQEHYQDNLSVRAARAGTPVTSNDLYDLFRPVAPSTTRPLVSEIQKAMGIQQVIAVPFFLETIVDGIPTRELIGNLFAATRSQSFQASEIELLRAFGQQAAAGLRNARLYHTAEERRQAAQMFGRMAFSANTAVHALANHIGIFQMHLELIKHIAPETYSQFAERDADVQARLQEAAKILNTLREPWQPISDELIDANVCLRRAIDKTMPLTEKEKLAVGLELSETALLVKTSPDMLTEAFKVLIKNALDAISERGKAGRLSITSRLDPLAGIEVTIRDNGVGIKPENINKIFDIGWTTKSSGLGFGLFWTNDYLEGLGGNIKVESIIGHGTVFRIFLPYRGE